MRARARHPRARAVLGILVVELLASRAGATPAVCRDAIVAARPRATPRGPRRRWRVRAATRGRLRCRRATTVDAGARGRTPAVRDRAALLRAPTACAARADDEPLAAIGWERGLLSEPRPRRLQRPDHQSRRRRDVPRLHRQRAAARDLASLSAVPATRERTRSARCVDGHRQGDGTPRRPATSKALARCWAARGEGTAHEPVPRYRATGWPDRRSRPPTARATTAICKACGGADHACGGGDDLAPAALGLHRPPARR